MNLIDTAGIHETADLIEQQGVERSRRALESAGLILVLVDSSEQFTAEDGEMLRDAVKRAPTILVSTKCDLPCMPLPALQLDPMPERVSISALTGQGLEDLESAVAKLFPAQDAPAGEILTNARQADAVGRALKSLRAAGEAMRSGFTPDAVLTETEEAMEALGELSGKTVREDITARIFERFCVGK